MVSYQLYFVVFIPFRSSNKIFMSSDGYHLFLSTVNSTFLQSDFWQIFNLLFTIIYLESEILSWYVFVCVIHKSSISWRFVGFQATKLDKIRQNKTFFPYKV